MTAQSLTTAGAGRAKASTFKANTRPGVGWSLVGGVAGALGPVLTPFIFPQGMLLVWESTVPAGDKPGEGWIGVSTMGPYRAKTRMKSPTGPVEISYTDGRVLAVMTFSKRGDEAPTVPLNPPVDYVALTDAVRARTEAALFDPAVAKSADFKSFFAQLRSAAAKTRDDVEYTFAGGLAWQDHSDLPLSLAYRKVDGESKRLVREVDGSVLPLSMKFDEKTRIATIEALAFSSAAEVDDILGRAIAHNPLGIVLDLRSCIGYDMAALRVVSHLMDSETDAGFFFSTKLRAQVEAGTIPDVPSVVVAGASGIEAAQAKLDEAGGLKVRVAPATTVFSGPLAVLTLSRTRSSGEVLAALLKGRANTRFFGGRTAGRPRLTFERELGQGFVIRVPEFDWRASTGERLNRGVAPDDRCDKSQAPQLAREWIVTSVARPGQ